MPRQIPPRTGLQLRPDYEAGWASQWNSSCGADTTPCISDLAKAGTVFGVFLGDELLGAGVTVSELTTAADTVKRDWPDAVVYWNEEWAPVVQNDTYAY